MVAAKFKLDRPLVVFIELPLCAIFQGTKLYIRNGYSELYEIVKQGSRMAITGTPGIGKSCFMLYIILRLLYESTANEPNIVIFHPEPKLCYCYCGTEPVLVGAISDFEVF